MNRQGEGDRFEPFKELHNRRLLWHGSRTTNYAGILSQGLRIAPPEAPVVSSVTVFMELKSTTDFCQIREQNALSTTTSVDLLLIYFFDRQVTCLEKAFTLQVCFKF